MLTTPFLTAVDPRGEVKGSRDPLGAQAIWTRLGRLVVGNLTTVTTSARDFGTLLLGYYFAERVAEDAPGTELDTFLKWEQLAAYARFLNGDDRFRGTERVQKALNESDKVLISSDQSGQILSNQKIYGLWGLYTVAGKASGLLAGEPTRLTAHGRRLVDGLYVPTLEQEGGRRAPSRILEILRARSTRVDLGGADKRLAHAVGKALAPELHPLERDVFRSHLVRGGPEDETHGLQSQLAELLLQHTEPELFGWSPQVLDNLERRSRALRGDHDPLADRLRRIRCCEALLAPSTEAFGHLLGLHGTSVNDAVARFQNEWGSQVSLVQLEEITRLEVDLGNPDAAAGARWVGIAHAMASGAYRTFIELLVEQNQAVMAARGSAAWLEIRGNQFHVRMPTERVGLPKRDDLRALFRHSYFLDALRLVAFQVEQPQ